MHALRHHHHQGTRCGVTATTTTPLRFLRRAGAPAAPLRRLPLPRASAQSEWQPVVDPATGRTYYWNTLTNATQWEVPPPPPSAAVAPPAAAPTTATTTTTPERGSFGAAATTDQNAPSREELLRDLIAAMNDGSGMAFWEAARERRKFGVFEDSYMDWLTEKVERGGEDGEVAERVRARLVNPLLRQPAPFEL
jgi:hypothetical protein